MPEELVFACLIAIPLRLSLMLLPNTMMPTIFLSPLLLLLLSEAAQRSAVSAFFLAPSSISKAAASTQRYATATQLNQQQSITFDEMKSIESRLITLEKQAPEILSAFYGEYTPFEFIVLSCADQTYADSLLFMTFKHVRTTSQIILCQTRLH